MVVVFPIEKGTWKMNKMMQGKVRHSCGGSNENVYLLDGEYRVVGSDGVASISWGNTVPSLKYCPYCSKKLPSYVKIEFEFLETKDESEGDECEQLGKSKTIDNRGTQSIVSNICVVCKRNLVLRTEPFGPPEDKVTVTKDPAYGCPKCGLVYDFLGFR